MIANRPEERFQKGSGPFLVGPAKGRSGRRLEAQVREAIQPDPPLGLSSVNEGRSPTESKGSSNNSP